MKEVRMNIMKYKKVDIEKLRKAVTKNYSLKDRLKILLSLEYQQLIPDITGELPDEYRQEQNKWIKTTLKKIMTEIAKT